MCVNSRSSLSRRKLATGPRSSCSGPAGARRRVCDVSEHEGACHVLGGGKADELQEACGDDGIRESGAGGVKNEGYDERQHHLAKRGGDDKEGRHLARDCNDTLGMGHDAGEDGSHAEAKGTSGSPRERGRRRGAEQNGGGDGANDSGREQQAWREDDRCGDSNQSAEREASPEAGIEQPGGVGAQVEDTDAVGEDVPTKGDLRTHVEEKHDATQ
eukprot:CAMPEP_0181176254 /NCGR_PEP_ID=MMETSP1096-20121128/4529_1 /TAXON_ID=156174 ORGANISM="Chrysochromulina ericina, Strain CCMP281" /NCGR_SAMPLE_ID=MMETSP1096 /ASSEMBLY_ACC=CAM_ASM_000453 /LENGTH=214 /DNA_ID=CAMNT_0023264325 /DNA_START=353 /DNA_END=994 /DNA_ORIENTATION=-